MKQPETYFVSAGEHSGDLLAANFVLSLRELNPDLEAFGLTGSAMRAARVDSITDMARFSVMGIADVARRLGELRILEKLILHRIDERNPKFAVLVDFPGLHFRLAEQLRLRQIPVIQYVAPKVWAWGQERVRNLQRDFDLVLGVLPFEEDFFKQHGVNYRYIGSPHKDRAQKVIVERRSLGLKEDSLLIGLLPGSRKAELEHILPRMVEVKKRLVASYPNAEFILPLATNLSIEDLQQCLPAKSELYKEGAGYVLDGIRIVSGMSLEVMSVSDFAIVGSGTATLECALLGTPMVVMYCLDQASYELVKNRVNVKHISLVNLIAGREMVREFVQQFSTDEVVAEIVSLIETDRGGRMVEQFQMIQELLPGNASLSAAKATNAHLQEKGIVPI